MNNIEIVFDRNTLDKSKKNKITSHIYMRLGEFCFPEEGWFDFTVVILTWWNKVILDFPNAGSDLLFMDGPFSIKISFNSVDSFNLECVHSKLNNNFVVEFRTKVLKKEIVNEIKRISTEVVEACENLDYQTDEVIELKSQLKRYS